jgi:hypothetical protein
MCCTPPHHEKVATVIVRTEYMMGAGGNGHTINGWAALQNVNFKYFFFFKITCVRPQSTSSEPTPLCHGYELLNGGKHFTIFF